MKKNIYSLLILFLVTNSVAEEQKKDFGQGTVVFPKQNLSIAVEVATTITQRSLGLMYREHLPVDEGMLFVFGQSGIQRVWMKHTLIPLDVLFISPQGTVVSVIKNLQPCITVSCEIHASTEISKYMLEVNAGMIARKNIEIGQQLKVLIQ